LGTATDVAGNSDSVTESGINVDKTAPTIAGAPTSLPNSNGWYAGDVTIHWTCGDALSGIDGSCPADSVITSEGDNLSVTASVSDRAGNSSTASVSNIKIDRTAPSTSASAPSAWVHDDVTVTLSPTDTLSGVAATYFSLDSAATSPGTSVPISSEGVHTLEYWSVDKAGNSEAHSTITIRIDKTAPTITHTQSPPANGNGWNKTTVTVTFDCHDQAALSGIASCTSPQTVSDDGQGQVVPGQAEDVAGNSATDSAMVNLDQTPPTITGAPDRTPNGAGWYRGNVTVTFACGDALSGVDSCTGNATLAQGANQSVSGTAIDAAGNSAHATVDHISIDKTPPTITGAPTTLPNANGWYSGDVTIHWTCSDALSGIDGACPANTVLNGEGGSLSASASIADVAGNEASATVAGIKIDRTAPVTQSDAPTGWRNTDVTVTLTATDNLSGVASTYSSVDAGAPVVGTSVTISASGSHTVEFWSRDRAGNNESHHTAIVLIDKTKPTITGAPTSAPNAAGWYRTPVTVHFTCADQANLSGLASCTADQTVSTSGANQSVTGTALDNAGNSSSYTVTGLKVDLVSPTVAISGIADGTSYPLGAVPAASCNSTDALSGSAGCTGVVAKSGVPAAPNAVGTYTYTATGLDVAGNVTTRVASFRVIYRFGGFLQPINDTAHDRGAETSVFKAGSTVPVKFDVERADGSMVTPGTAPVWLTPVKGSSLSAAVDEGAYVGAPTDGDTYRVAGSQYIYNWSTKGLPAGFYYRIGVRLDDGTTYTVNIGLR